MQKRYYSLTGINAGLGYAMDIAKLGQVYPKAMRSLDVLNFDNLMREALEDGGAPAMTVFDESEVGQNRQIEAQAVAEAQQQQARAQAAALTVQNADKLGQAPMQGSPLAEAAEAQK